MVKFTKHSAIKQYMPLKPIRKGIKGIKLWLCCNSYTEYCYNVNVYSGKEVFQEDSTISEL